LSQWGTRWFTVVGGWKACKYKLTKGGVSVGSRLGEKPTRTQWKSEKNPYGGHLANST